MGTRSKYLGLTIAAAGAGAIVAARRFDQAHAPGHRHLPPAQPGEPAPAPLQGRPWTKHAHGMHHPFSGN